MISLLDVNVLFALAWPRHVHHDPALKWFEEARHDGWATCAITESGFVRISCNPVIVGHEVTPNEAIQILERLMAIPMHTFVPLNRSLTQLPPDIQRRLTGPRQITDAILLAAAVENQCQLATLDTRLASLAPREARRHLRVIPA